MYDTKTRWDRIGDYLLANYAKKVALPIIYLSIAFIVLMFVATVFINKATAEISYKNAIANIRYENIKH